MDPGRPSRTALRVALRRAAHQLYDAEPRVLPDPFAVPILGPAYRDELLRTPRTTERSHSRALRAWLVARSRFTEDHLAASLQHGISQYVVLGAGLDTFALRNPFRVLQVFEVDHPATQAWKFGLLSAANLPLPPNAHLVALDFERQNLLEILRRAGFDSLQPTLFSWLGVVPYLSLEGFRRTLGQIATLAAGSSVVMDYGQPRSALPQVEQRMHDSLAERVALAGEPFQTFFKPPEMRAELHAFRRVEDLGTAEMNARYFHHRPDGLRLLGSAARIAVATL